MYQTSLCMFNKLHVSVLRLSVAVPKHSSTGMVRSPCDITGDTTCLNWSRMTVGTLAGVSSAAVNALLGRTNCGRARKAAVPNLQVRAVAGHRLTNGFQFTRVFAEGFTLLYYPESEA